MSGSTGALVASHNRGGAYFRTRTIPTNPNTMRQQAVRSAFGTLVQYWTSTLSAAQRALWADYASNTPVIDALGYSINLTGQNMFIRTNTPAVQAGIAIIEDAPTTYNTGEPPTSMDQLTDDVANRIGIDSGGTAYDTLVHLAGGASSAGNLLLYLGATLNPTRNYYKGPYQLVSATSFMAAASTVSVTTTFATAENANGNPVDGQIRGIRARCLFSDGRLSQPYDAILTVLAAV